MTYSALDNLEAAKRFREQLILERDDINSSLGYEHATSWCDDCPRREPREPQSYEEMYFPRPPAPTCCKEDGGFDEDHMGDYNKVDQITVLINALSAYIGEEVPQS